MSVLNQVLSGLHRTDVILKNKIEYAYEGVGLSSIQKDVNEDVIPILGEDGKFNPSYNSTKIASIDNDEGADQLQKVKFIGDCKVTYGADGNLVIRIGENLNSSNFNNTDGKTVGTNITTANSGTNIGATPASDLDGVTASMYKNAAVTITENAFIHFDNNATTTFSLSAIVGKSGTTTVFSFGPITGNGTYQSGTEGISLVVSNFGQEANAAEGATGYQGKVQFVLTNAAIESLAQNQDISFKAAHSNASEETKTYGPTSKWFIIDNDSDNIAPAIGSSSIGFTQTASVTNSGVTYSTAGKVTVTASSITNINNPGYYSSPMKTVASTAWFTGDSGYVATGVEKTGNATTDTASYSREFTALKTGYFTNPTATLYVKNCNSEASSVLTYTGIVNIDATNKTAPTDSTEYFKNETKRLQSDCSTAFDNTASIENTTDLMVTCGTLTYPSASKFGNTYDTSAKRYYYRKFIAGSGTKFGGTLTFAGLGNKLDNANFEAFLSIDGGESWLNLKADRGGNDATGIRTSYNTSSGALAFSFPGTTSMTASNGVILKLGWTSAAAVTITQITLAM